MNRYLKWSLIGTATLIALLAALALAISLTVDPNDYKPLIVDQVQAKKQRRLQLDGDIRLTLFPRLGADLGKVSLSEHKGEAEFARVERARVALALWPLLRKQLVVDEIRIVGLRANLVRYKDGRSNFDDLLQTEEKSDSPLSFDIDHVSVRDTALTFDDRRAGRKVQISDFNLETGRLADKTPGDIDLALKLKLDAPAVDAGIRVKSDLYFDLAAKQYRLSDLDAGVRGAAAGISGLDLAAAGDLEIDAARQEMQARQLKLSLKGKQGERQIDATLELPGLQLTEARAGAEKLVLVANLTQGGDTTRLALRLPTLTGTAKALTAPQLELELDSRQSGRAIQAKLAGPLKGSVSGRSVELPKLAGQLELTDPALAKGGLRASLDGRLAADFAKPAVDARFDSRIDDSRLQLKLELSRFTPPRIGFDLNIDQIDLDRYLPPADKTAAPATEKPFDLSALRQLDLQGKVSIGKLKAGGVRASSIRLKLRASDGALELDPLSVNLYEGSLSGSVRLEAATPPRLALRQKLSNVAVGPLLRDVAQRDLIEGRGNVTLDLDARATTAGAMKRALAGNAAVELRDGAIKGIDIAGAIRGAQSKLGLKGRQSQSADARERTDFSELKATFRITEGVAYNNDLSLRSPLLRVGGEGRIDIGGGSVDYLVKASVVGSLEGQGGRDNLRGLTVPVRASGPFDKIGYTLDFGAMAQEAVKQEVKTKVEDALKDQMKGLFR